MTVADQMPRGGRATIADMTAAIGFHEDYDDAHAHSDRAEWRGFGDYTAALGLDPEHVAAPGRPASIRSLLRAIVAGSRPHGEAFAQGSQRIQPIVVCTERALQRVMSTQLLLVLSAPPTRSAP